MTTQGTTSILPFASGDQANVVTDSQWQALLNSGSLQTGFVQGLAQSAQVNKALRQTSIISAGVGQFLANQGNDVDDSLTQQQIAQMLKNSVVNAISTSNVSGYIQAWKSSVADNGVGYPKYAVVADPTDIGVLYMSTEDNNTNEPSATNYGGTGWLMLPPNRILSVEAFGVVNDPDQENVNANTAAFQNAVSAVNASKGLIALYIPSGMTFYVNEAVVFNADCRLIIDGNLWFTGSGYSPAITLNGNNTSIIEGCGCIGAASNNIAVGIDASVSAIVKGVWIRNFTQYGLKINNAQSYILGVGFKNKSYGLYINNGEVIAANCMFNDGVFLNTGNGIQIQGCHFYLSSGDPAIANATGNGLTDVLIKNCYFFQTEYGAISLQGDGTTNIYQITIEGCHFFKTGTRKASNDIYIASAQHVFIKNNTTNGCSNVARNLSSGETISSVFVDGNSSYVVIKDNVFKNVGQTNITCGYGINAQGTKFLTVDGNLFTNPTGVMIAPMEGVMVSSWYLGRNTWNPNEFLSAQNMQNNPQNGIGVPFINANNGCPTTIQTDIIRKVFNLENIGKDWWDGLSGIGTLPNVTTTPKSIIARKTSLGWVAKQAVWWSATWTVPGQSHTNMYWLVPFLEIWKDTAQGTIFQSNPFDGQIAMFPTVSINGSTGDNDMTEEYCNYCAYQIGGTWTLSDGANASIKVEVEGLVDINKVINLQSINQYLPSNLQ